MNDSTKPTFIAVKGFEKFQHYKGRTPPWIKFYNALLDDYRFLKLSDAARSQLMLIWLVASRHHNRIPNDAKYITEAIHCTTKLQLGPLIESGFLHIVGDAATEDASDPLADDEQDASNLASNHASTLQADCPQNADLEAEREREAELETERETTSSSTRAAPAEAISDKPFVDQLLEQVPQPQAWRAEIRACLAGMPGHYRATREQIEVASRDMLANGKLQHPNIRQFRRYIQGAAESQQPPPNSNNGANGKPSPMERSIANTRRAFGGGT